MTDEPDPSTERDPRPEGDAAPAMTAPVGDASARARTRLGETVAARLGSGDAADPATLSIPELASDAFGPLADEMKQMVGGSFGGKGLELLQQSLDVVDTVLSPSMQEPAAALALARSTVAGQPDVDPGRVAMLDAQPDGTAPAAPDR